MKPYYSHNGITIYHADCREVLPNLPDQSIDLVLTDPPYGVGFDYGTGYKDSPRGYIDFLWPIIEVCEQKVKEGGYIAVYQAAKYARLWHQWFPREWRLFALPKLFGQIRHTDIQWCTDYVLFWMVGQGKKKRLRESGIARDFFVSEQVLLRRDPLLSGHPCPRPIDQVIYLIESLSPTKSTILDPFLGSGTTVVAAKILGRKAIGIEIEERYCEIAAKRLQQEVLLQEA